jgi:hypothetical protein
MHIRLCYVLLCLAGRCLPRAVYSSVEGRFSDGSWEPDAQYATDMRCEYIIEHSGSLEIFFSSFDLGGGDEVVIYNGIDLELARYFGRDVPPPFRTLGPVRVVFTSDSQVPLACLSVSTWTATPCRTRAVGFKPRTSLTNVVPPWRLGRRRATLLMAANLL